MRLPRTGTGAGTGTLALAAAIALLAAAGARATSVTLRQAGSAALNVDTVIHAGPGDSIDLEVVLDTGGLSYEGHAYNLDFSGGSVNAIALSRQDLSPLIADLLDVPVIDDAADLVTNITAGTLGTGLAAGVYVLDVVSFVVGVIPDGGIDVEVFLRPGDTFGLGGGTETPTFFGAKIVPEAATGVLLALGLGALAVARARSDSGH